ncbi:ABC transporter ATP-binding protein [Virgibacillus dokdonensis]|uniref:ABC transporter ATP-binding protein n=1 Tax=Virgibacillus dokdonensis TaxID=302167 RepID=UPI00098A40FD|nr:ABC transporter ATP-binding protein [Virgibacillus dokdonensis]
MELKDITFSYDLKNNHLVDVNGEINRGKITTIIGPNGSGKSTLLGIMSNQITPHKGYVRLDGKQLVEFRSKEFARKVAVVHQRNSAPADMTVEKLISYGRLPYKSFLANNKQEDAKVIEWALQKTNLSKKRNHALYTLSGGEQQRVWIALTLAQRTPFLFLDEPTTYLDIYYQYELLEFIKKLNRDLGITIVMVLHDINQAIRYSDIIIAMKHGQIVKKGVPKDVITNELMKEVYGINVLIKENKDTGIYTIPIGI